MFPQDSRNRWKNGRQTPWAEIPDSDWNAWTWQMQHRVTTRERLAEILELSPQEIAGFEAAQNRLAFAVTPHFLNLIDRANPDDPLRKQIVPVADEARIHPHESCDPIGEEKHSPVPGLVHRYPDRVLLLATDRCASYCRFCTRSRFVSNASGYGFRTHLDAALRYIADHENIRDVLISGGDSLLLADEKIDTLLGQLRTIPHVEFIRIGTRVPVFLPQRITPGLCEILKKHGPVWMSIHVNHPDEICEASAQALEKLAFSGTVLGSQSVLLRGVNDDADIIRSLVHRLLQVRVRPYYLYACDPISGSAHWRVPVQKGIEIIHALRGNTSGYAIPQFVIDAPGGGGKIPVNPNYVESVSEDGRFTLRNFRNERYVYPG